jgi:hypothetical protein
MLKVGDKARVKNPDLETKDEVLEQNTVDILEELNFIGEVTQVQDGLFYLGFKSKEGRGWLTQVFKEEEIEEVKE